MDAIAPAIRDRGRKTTLQSHCLEGAYALRYDSRCDPDGMISLVLVGDIPAAGMTPTATFEQRYQSTRLKKYIQDPSGHGGSDWELTASASFWLAKSGRLVRSMLDSGHDSTAGDCLQGAVSRTFANSKRIYILRERQQESNTKIPFNYKAGAERRQKTRGSRCSPAIRSWSHEEAHEDRSGN